MRASRLLSILMLLQSRGRMSAQAIAGELEVSVRTVFRDIDQLSAAGVPVWADRGRNGGFQLQDGWRTKLDGLTNDEARAIFMTGLPGPAAELGLGDAMASAELKLLAAMPPDWQADARRVGSRFHLDPVEWFRNAEPAGHLRAVAEAVWTERRLKMRYRSWNRVSDRVVDPLGLVLKAGMWYMVARSDGELRTFRLSNILALEPLDARFARPQDFDLSRYWKETTERFEAGVYRGEAQLRVSPLGLKRLQGFSPIVAASALRSASEPDADGWIRVTVPIESVEDAARELLRLGAEGEAIEPPEVRNLLAGTAERLASIYLSRRAARPSRSRRQRAKG